MASETMDTDPTPNSTVYIRNLPEKLPIPELQSTLQTLFKEFGTILEIIAKRNIRARGQAFIVFDNDDAASDAVDIMNDFEVQGKKMVVQIARSKSDKTVQREEGDEALRRHKEKRLAEKEVKNREWEAKEGERVRVQKERMAEEKRKKGETEDGGEHGSGRPKKISKTEGAGGVVPDEYLPPSKELVVKDVPEDYTAATLTAIFGRYAGFREVRMTAFRKGIAFVEYETESAAAEAKEKMDGVMLSQKKIKVTFQRRQ